MAKYLNVAAKQAIIQSLLAGLLYAMCLTIAAQTLVDPTRPPPGAGPIAHEDKTAIVPNAGPALQSILISPLRVEAIISGRTIKLGDKFGDAKVVKITENAVVLRNGNDSQTLKLFPDIEKRPHSSRAGANVDGTRQ